MLNILYAENSTLLFSKLMGDSANAVPRYQKVNTRVIYVWDYRKEDLSRSAMAGLLLGEPPSWSRLTPVSGEYDFLTWSICPPEYHWVLPTEQLYEADRCGGKYWGLQLINIIKFFKWVISRCSRSFKFNEDVVCHEKFDKRISSYIINIVLTHYDLMNNIVNTV